MLLKTRPCMGLLTLVIACLIQVASCSKIEEPVLKPGEKGSFRAEFIREYIKGTCSSEDHDKVSRQVMATGCRQPRLTLVNVASNNPALTMHPVAVMVNRCVGVCSKSSKSCFPSSMRRVNKTARWVDSFKQTTAASSCGEIEVEEHLKCSCGCTIKQEDCSDLQEYSPKRCMCQCINSQEEMQTCESTNGKMWNHAECRCVCSGERSCSSGFVWIPERCGCGRVLEMESDVAENNVMYTSSQLMMRNLVGKENLVDTMP